NARAGFGFCGALKPIKQILSVIETQSELANGEASRRSIKTVPAGAFFHTSFYIWIYNNLLFLDIQIIPVFYYIIRN
ncbi:MAG: hypothetical protein K6D95_11835, partial [Treponema sp.]|nr:hypothetical protein [Treponema sp.]